MAHFYASIDRSARKNAPTARGHASTGISAYCASWSGRVAVTLYADPETGRDRFRVIQEPHKGRGVRETLAEGFVGEPMQQQEKDQ